MLSLNNVTFRYSGAAQAALSDVSFDLPSGALLGLLGVNGAGKSTLVTLLMGLRAPDRGTLLFNGEPTHLGRTDIGYVPQEYAFYDELNFQQNLDYFAAVQLKGKQSRGAAIKRVVAQCNLEPLLMKRVGASSGGEKRKLNLAIALLNLPQLLILDEPTANVDPSARAEIITLVRTLNADGITVIYTSHLLGEVQSLCDTFALIHGGKLRRFGSKASMLESPVRSLLITLCNQRLNHAWLAKLSPELQAATTPSLNQNIDALTERERDASQYEIDLSRCEGRSIAACMTEIEMHAGAIESIHTQSQTLEDVFLALVHEEVHGV